MRRSRIEILVVLSEYDFGVGKMYNLHPSQPRPRFVRRLPYSMPVKKLELQTH